MICRLLLFVSFFISTISVAGNNNEEQNLQDFLSFHLKNNNLLGISDPYPETKSQAMIATIARAAFISKAKSGFTTRWMQDYFEKSTIDDKIRSKFLSLLSLQNSEKLVLTPIDTFYTEHDEMVVAFSILQGENSFIVKTVEADFFLNENQRSKSYFESSGGLYMLKSEVTLPSGKTLEVTYKVNRKGESEVISSEINGFAPSKMYRYLSFRKLQPSLSANGRNYTNMNHGLWYAIFDALTRKIPASVAEEGILVKNLEDQHQNSVRELGRELAIWNTVFVFDELIPTKDRLYYNFILKTK